jgi:hypothetical protein
MQLSSIFYLAKEVDMFKADFGVLLAAILISSAALAQTTPAPVQPKTENGIRYLCGGIGLDESDYMKSEARKHGLLMTFAARDGSYLANVHVDIADSRGKSVLAVDCDAPMLLLDLPRAGSYKIKAETAGTTLTRNASVQGKGVGRVVFVWPVQDHQSDMGASK